MDFQINKGLNLKLNGRSVSTEVGSLTDDPTETSIVENLTEPSTLESFEDRISIPREPSEGQSQVISNIQEAVGTAQAALAAINDLREKQLDYVELTKNIAYGEQSEDIANEVDAIQAEIEDIAARATYNGVSVLNSGSTYTYDNTATDTHSVVTLPSVTSQLSDLPQSQLNQENSETNEEFLEESLFGIRALSDAVSASAEKSEQLERPEPDLSPLDEAERNEQASQTPADFSEARELAGKIAQKLSSPYIRENQNSSLIRSFSDNLDEDRVKNLLVEA